MKCMAVFDGRPEIEDRSVDKDGEKLSSVVRPGRVERNRANEI